MSNFKFALQKYAPKDYSGLITQNNLHEMYMKEPELVSKTIKLIYESTLGHSMMDFYNRFPSEEVEQENEFYEWMLKGQDEKNIALVDAYNNFDGTLKSSAGTLPDTNGKGGAFFYVLFAEPLFDEGDVIRGEQEEYHLLIDGKYSEGQYTKYKVAIVGTAAESVPSEELAVGTRWNKDYNLQQNELSYRGTKPQMSSPFAMQNRPSMMRMEYMVPGSMIAQGENEPLRFNFVGPNGTNTPVWTNYIDMISNYQFDMQFMRMNLFGRKNWDASKQYNNRDTKTNFTVASGAGLFQQIAPSNRHYYNDYNLDWHVDMLIDMGVGKLERGKRKINILTGEHGAIAIHKQIEAKARQWGAQAVAPMHSKGNAANIGTSNPLGFGGQYTKYVAVNGVELNVEILPFLDDDTRFKTNHPDRGLVSSHRMISLDYGGEAGIKQIKVKGRDEVSAVVEGIRSATSPGKNAMKSVASKIDGYEVVKARWGGMKIEDPTKVVDLQYNYER